jgi:iron complex transport system substrate-binding protein
MRRLLVALLLCAGVARADIAVRDDAGDELRLPAPARRIVSLAPHITEDLFAAGAGERVVGTVQFSDYPPAAQRITRVGGYERFDMEAILALHPDLVIAWRSGNPPAQVERLRAVGLPVFVVEPDRIEDVARDLERFGVLAGTEATARAAAAAFRARLAQLAGRYADRPKVRTFYQVWNRPILTVGGRQIISDAIRICGGDNVFGRLDAMAPAVSEEAVIAANPEAIVASGMDEARPDWVDYWRRWPQLTAVARGNLFFVPPDLIQRHTPRLLDGTERLCQALETARARRPR